MYKLKCVMIYFIICIFSPVIFVNTILLLFIYDIAVYQQVDIVILLIFFQIKGVTLFTIDAHVR